MEDSVTQCKFNKNNTYINTLKSEANIQLTG